MQAKYHHLRSDKACAKGKSLIALVLNLFEVVLDIAVHVTIIAFAIRLDYSDCDRQVWYAVAIDGTVYSLLHSRLKQANCPISFNFKHALYICGRLSTVADW